MSHLASFNCLFCVNTEDNCCLPCSLQHQLNGHTSDVQCAVRTHVTPCSYFTVVPRPTFFTPAFRSHIFESCVFITHIIMNCVICRLTLVFIQDHSHKHIGILFSVPQTFSCLRRLMCILGFWLCGNITCSRMLIMQIC